MPANNALLLTDINFDTIKSNLKTFLSNQTELGDYDYESSTMQILLNLLSYNTYMNSFYLNMVGNEMFLDSAQIRSNVVSRAKMLGYTPKSAKGPTAEIQVTIVPNDSPDTILIPANTTFFSTIDGQQYVFVNPSAAIINANSSGVYSQKISITEGRPFIFRYTVSSVTPQRYVIPNDNVDASSISVSVQESISNTSITTFTRATNLISINGNTAAFFLEENSDEKYELFFGNGVIGKQLNDGNIVNIGYRICNTTEAESAFQFTSGNALGGYTDYSITTISPAVGSSEKETIQSIKFNAPKYYQTQNRAITVNDFKSLIKSNFSFVQSVNAWGGEKNDPPIYGKVFVSIKPTTGLLLSSEQKASIKSFIEDRSTVSTELIVNDPSYLYIIPTVNVKYNSDLTTSSSASIVNTIANKIIDFELNNLGLFDRNFVGSEFIKSIDSANESITSVAIKLKLMRKFIPLTNLASDYNFSFNMKLLNITGGAVLRGISPTAHPGRGLTVDSSFFTYFGKSKSKFDDDGFGNIRIYYLNSEGVRIYTNKSAGVVDYNTGKIKLTNLLITDYEGSNLEFIVDPDSIEINSTYNQILLFDKSSVSLYDEKLKAVTGRTSNISTQGVSTNIADNAIVATVY